MKAAGCGHCSSQKGRNASFGHVALYGLFWSVSFPQLSHMYTHCSDWQLMLNISSCGRTQWREASMRVLFYFPTSLNPLLEDVNEVGKEGFYGGDAEGTKLKTQPSLTSIACSVCNINTKSLFTLAWSMNIISHHPQTNHRIKICTK